MKELLPALLIGAFFWISSPTLLAQASGTEAYQQAERLRQQNRCEEALKRYDAAIRMEPENHRYYLQRARCEYRLNRMAAARVSLERAIEVGEAHIPASTYYLLGKIYLNEEENLDRATQYYRLAAEKETEPTRQLQYQLLLVQSLSNLEQYAEAERSLQTILEDYPDNVAALYYQAQLSAAKGEWDRAIVEYEKALRSSELREANPEERAKYYYGMGEAYEALGNEEQARKAYEEADHGPYRALVSPKIRDNDPTHLYKVAVSYYLVDEFEASDAYIQRVLAEDPRFSSAYILLSRIAQKNHQTGEAVAQLEKAISYEQDSTEKARLLMQLAELQARDDNHSAALQAVLEAIESDMRSLGSSRLLYVKARAEYETGRYAEALQSFERLLRIPGLEAKTKPRFNFMMGMAAKQAGEFGKARKAFENASYGAYLPAAEEELAKLRR